MLKMKDDDVLVIVEGLSKKFCKDLKTSLWYGMKDLVSNIRGNKNEKKLRDKEFWAVKDINFELQRGECLGLIGHNGAGKSTLLKILNGLINPDAGKITIRGRVGALIELGAGFNPILSGRENIYNNGAILGFTKKEIDAKVEEIIDFSEIREFIDMPIQNYSSGMKVRLGFAVAAQLEPDILLIDEVLAVGDLGFVLKCLKTIDKILPNTAIIFVSHSMPMVSRICSKIILLDSGKSLYLGKDVGKGIDKYYARFATNESNIIFTDNTIALENIKLLNPSSYEGDIPQLQWRSDLELHFKFKILSNIPSVEFFVIIADKEQRQVALLESNKITCGIVEDNGIIEFTVKHDKIQLSKGIYSINFSARLHSTKEPILRINDVLVFQILHEKEAWEPFLLESKFKKK
ncbi:ABC transporter ATP-binding protein [Algibacter aquimarinus]|uniref:ABC transporter domain-containing protein n=1 Tax=Algibacter aquimarinus TaxID=1136748 RepID=A0ABP9HR69_9FLAO